MEKKLNHNDLKTFKQNKVEYEGMVPGIHNIQSIGSKPTLRRAMDDMGDSSNYASMPSKQLNRSSKDLRSSVKPLENFAQRDTTIIKNDRYDPITNPIPFVNQNPYILKEKTMIGGEGITSLIGTGRRSGRSLLSSTAEKNILI